MAPLGGTAAIIGEVGRDEAVIPLPDDWRHNCFGGGGGIADSTCLVLMLGGVRSKV